MDSSQLIKVTIRRLTSISSLIVLAAFASSASVAQPNTAPSGLLQQLEENGLPAKGPTGKPVNHIDPTHVIHWSLAGQNFDEASQKLYLTLALKTERQFTIYVDKLKFEPAEGWQISAMTNPKAFKQFDPISRKEVDVYSEGAFDLTLEKTGLPDSASVNITYVGCTTVICLFPHTEKIQIQWTNPSSKTAASDAAAASITEKNSNSPNDSSASLARDAAPASGTVEEQFARRVKSGQMSFAMLLLIAFAGGLLTNLTPCVAPMIPITIRLLSNQTAKPIASSAMYAGGIVATYTSLGVIAALSGALFGNLVAHPAVSISFGVVMFVLGLNMLGFGDLSKLQQIGGRIGSSKGGLFNSFLMGAGAGLVASPCTGPILAALLTYTAGRQNTLEAIGLLGVYSTGFALPYVFLGASAAKISKVRVSFHVQILTKLVFASVMFALSLYFMRIPLYGLFTQIRPYWGLVGMIGLTAGVLFSLVIILRETLHHKKIVFLLPTLTLGAGLFFGLQALTRNSGGETKTVQWLHSEAEAIESAMKSNKPILVDAWAEWCEACKKMDVTTFANEEVIDEISAHWIALKYDLTESTDANLAIQEKYELPGLPTLTLMPPDGNLKSKVAITGYSSAPALLENLRKHHSTLSNTQGQ
jgi:thiol:disulfide interchange protein DsbD